MPMREAMDPLCGIDEAGRGPIAGPVTAAAVMLPRDFPFELLADSKKLSPARRMRAAGVILERAVWGVGWAWPEEIDRLNIHRATLLAMRRAYLDLGTEAERVAVDGLFVPELPCPVAAEVKGDDRIPQIMAASILAKTVRDRWMERYSWIEPQYRFEKHKGYPTEEHRRLIREHGYSRIHRKSFTFCFPS
jgi:ribonuclease HII